jgi:exosortase
LPAIAIVAASAAFGVATGRRLSFAFAYLYFAIPIWSEGNEFLQAITVFAVRLLLQVTAIPAYVTGNIVQIPSGAFEIAGGCSGLHFFIVALAIAALFGEIHRDSPRVRLLQLLLAASLAMISNWVRVYIIILAGHLTDMQHFLITVDHYYFGWFLFVLTMAAFFWIAGRMPVSVPPATPGIHAGGSAPRATWIGAVVISIIAAGIGPAFNALRPIQEAVASRSALPALSRWSGPLPSLDSWRPSYPRANRTEMAEYRLKGRSATAFVAQYFQQRQGQELVGFDNDLAGGGESRDRLRTVQAGEAAVATFESGGKSARWITVYTYLIGDVPVTGGFRAQVAYAKASLQGPVLSQVVAVRTECGSDCEAALADATDLLDEISAAMRLNK